MGGCFSKRKEPSSDPFKKKIVQKGKQNNSVAAKKKSFASVLTATPQSIKAASFTPEEKEKKKPETPTEKKSQLDNNKSCSSIAITASADNQSQVPMRSSSYNMEELEAILISSGYSRRYSSSNKSFDFDNEMSNKEEREYESRERGSNVGSRVSRSPVRRSDYIASSVSCSDEKTVSVPAREKKDNAKISNENSQLWSQNWSHSKKDEKSPSRRIPMAEIDENALRAENHHLRFHNGGNVGTFQKSRDLKEEDRKPIRLQTQSEQSNGLEAKDILDETQRKQQMQPEMVDKTMDAEKEMSSKKSSQELENNSGYNPASQASFLLEDIENSMQQKTPFSISATNATTNISSCSQIGKESLESELFLKNKLMQPSLFKNVTVRNLESQESIGSNSFVGQPWTSPCEPNSDDSTDRFLCSQRSRTPPSVSSIQTAPAAAAATPSRKKREIGRRKLLQDGGRDSTFSAGTF